MKYYSLRNRIGFWYWAKLKKIYGPIQNYIKDNLTNKILYGMFTIIDIAIFIISYTIIMLCGLKME